MSKEHKLNIHIYPSFLTNESRILRECKSLVSLGLISEARVIGYWKNGLEETEKVSKEITFVRLKNLVGKKRGGLKFLNLFSFPLFYLSVLAYCRRNRPSIVNCHTLTVLPLGVIIKTLFGSQLIYDAHELETETNDSKGVRKVIAKLIERIFINSTDSVIVVGDMIRAWYRERYKLNNIHVIKNIPLSNNYILNESPLRKKVGLADTDIVFLYVGSLEQGRGIPILLNAFSQLTSKKHLIFLGYGSYSTIIKEFAVEFPNIHLIDAVHPSVVLDYVSGADVGICLIENTCLSYYYCLPNKSFEYITAEVPFICSNFPEMINEFAQSDICWFSDVTLQNFKSLVNGLTQEEIKKKKQLTLEQRYNWGWEKEENKYIDIYTKLI